MADPISPVLGLDALAGVQSNGTTSDLDVAAFLGSFEKGIDTLAPRPSFGDDLSQLDAMAGANDGDVGTEKVEMLAKDTKAGREAEAASSQTLEKRVQSLHFELTHYQLAWRIAQNVQRDISQVLRGS